ncbi:MAG: BamA/OMP85 family outer membrane protein, partial [Candidatus Methylomirabilaceae bacterium]
IGLVEGDLYNSRVLARSRQNLTNLGFFEDVKVDTRRGTAEDRVDIDVGVKEKPTGSFSLGAGFSSIDGLLGAGSISQNNFLGLGQRIIVSAQLGSNANRFVLRFQDPHILDTETSLDLSLYNQRLLFQDFTGFDQDAVGGSLTLARRLTRDLVGSLLYKYEQVDIFNIVPELANDPRIVPGKTTTGSVSVGLSMDLRDNRRDPTRGFSATMTYQLAADFFGGDNNFNRFSLDAGYYYPLFWKALGHLRGNLIIVEPFGSSTQIPTQERVYLGGTNTVRGFKTYSLGPKFPGTDEPIGGNKAIWFNAELLFPIYEALGVRGLLFIDAGNVFLEGQALSLDLRPTAGGGLRVATPFGLVRVEIGFNLDKQVGERTSAIHLTVGSVF